MNLFGKEFDLCSNEQQTQIADEVPIRITEVYVASNSNEVKKEIQNEFYRSRNHEIPALNTASLPRPHLLHPLLLYVSRTHEEGNCTREVSSPNGYRAFTLI